MPAAAELAATDPDYVDSLERGLSVLRAFSAREEALSVADVASLVGITRTAARRFALTLEYLGYAGQSAEGYTLTPGVLAIGDAYLRSSPLPDAAHPHLATSGTGGAQAIEDGATLAVLLAKLGREKIPLALKAFEKLRYVRESISLVLAYLYLTITAAMILSWRRI